MTRNLPAWLVRYRFLVLAGVIVLVGLGVFLFLRSRQAAGPRGQAIPIESGGDAQVVEPGAVAEGAVPISVRLSAGQPQPQQAAPLPQAQGEPLPQDALERILARLPDLPGSPDDAQDFRFPEEVLPPPRPGQTVEQPFPPAPEDLQPGGASEGPLEVLRFSPEGEIPIAPFLSVTFNQPMVALGTLESLGEGPVPVQLEPGVPGTWRWLGTRTLTFQADSELIDRLPKATEYRATVPAGTASASGNTLAEAVTWTFRTPPPKVTFTYPPDSPQPLEPLFFIHFDQRVDPDAVLGTIQVQAGAQSASLTLVERAEIEADEDWKGLLKNSQDGRWVAFRATEPLPADSPVTVTIGPGTPSAEGPLVTEAAQTYSFHTYAPLRVEEHGCSWGQERCPPLTPFFIRFNNPIDQDSYTDTLLTIEPALPGAVVNVFGNTLEIHGASQGQTTYTITVSPEIQDVFGQRLGRTERLTFRVGPAEPVLYGPDESFVTVDPAAPKPVFSVYALNYPRLEVEVYAVQPGDWPAYQQYLRDYQRTDVQVRIPGRRVIDRTQMVEAAADRLTQVDVDLSPVMDGRFGHFIVIVRPPTALLQDPQEVYWRTIQAWVQVTQIGLDAFTDHSEMVVWATNLNNGAPLAEVTVSAGPGGQQFVTGSDGTVRLAIPESTLYLTASQGADQAMLPRSPYFWDEQRWNSRPVNDTLRWYVFDDRQMYRPGEEVHLKGWLRRVGGKQTGDVALVGPEIEAVRYRLTDSQGNELATGRADVNDLGGFDFILALPQQTNLGIAALYLTAEGSLGGLEWIEHYHTFQIQEFRRPEFEVNARNETTGPYFAGGNAVVAVEAKYYAGDPLPNAEVNWQVISSPGHYAPPNWPDFSFGQWTPWWWFARGTEMDAFGDPFGGSAVVETFSGVTDASGQHYLQLDFEQGDPPEPLSVVAEPTVIDVNRQAWTGRTTLLVHPASLYVGLRSERYFVERGTPLKVDLIVTDLDGNPVADRPITARAARLEWKYTNGQWAEEEVDVQTCTVGSAQVPVTCTFDTPIGGSYRITAEVTDPEGRLNQSVITRWVSGGELPPAREVEQEKLTLIPDKETYQPGDVAQILVQAPFSVGEGLLSVHRSGLLYTRRFSLVNGAATLEVPIEEAHVPNLQLQVDVNGEAPRTDDQGEVIEGLPPRPAFASGQINLSIPPLSRTLALELALGQAELEPGGQTTLDVLVKDSGGNPLEGAELAAVVVDEAVLALSSYRLGDPLATYYEERMLDWLSVYTRASIILVDPLALAQNRELRQQLSNKAVQDTASDAFAGAMEAPAAAPEMAVVEEAEAGAGQDGDAAQQPIRVRTDFNPLATFAPAARTGADGRATVSVTVPDNLTRYRVMVVAVDGGGRFFGQAESSLVARLPLMVRPSAPRFLNFGDRFELPIVLQNQTDQPMPVEVVVRANNLLLTGAAGDPPAAGMVVTVPARDRVEVRFPAAAQLAGTARLQVAAVAGDFADAATIELPVYTPATSEAFATYGVVDDGAVAQPVSAPQGVFPQYGGLEITTSSTALQALTDAVLYLESYPFECAEQMASRILGIAALRDVLTAFQAEGLPSPAEMEAAVQRDIETLQKMQNDDGGFPWWRRGQDSIPFVSIHVAHALQRAEAKGFSAPDDMQQRVLEHLRQIENYYPTWYDQHTRWTLSAYALYVRDLMGDSDPAKAQRLLDEAGLENLSLDALGWLWPVLQDASGAGDTLEAIRRHVNNRAVETAGAANFTTAYTDQNYLLLGSDRRTDAILLDALILDNPQHDLVPKLVNGLLAHRTRGRWGNTQENVFVLLALDRYFNTFEAQTPDFVARIWLGDTYAGSHEYRGRTTERNQTGVPMAYLVDPALGGGQTRDLVLSKDGAGRLYYRLGLRYAPDDLQLDPLDMGFVVQREYEAVDDPADVTRDPDGTWRIKAGARVKVRLSMVADNRRYHVALVDPLPAGLESINPALAVTGTLPQDPNQPDGGAWWWWGPWYEHQNLRDQRAEAFTSLLWEGVYEYTYFTRATTPGTFIVPPAKAEEMYAPEVFGRSGSDIVIVE
jgi:uncharacterized protein YfaS (alpha-2-macroglobulin family)